MNLSRILPALFLLPMVGYGCKARRADSGLRETPTGGAAAEGGVGQSVSCLFTLPNATNDNFKVTATIGASALSNVTGTFTKNQAADSPKTVASAPLAVPDVLVDMWDKKLADQKPTDRQIRAYEKQHFFIDHKEYNCFNISGAGPKQEDYLCFHKSGQVGASQALWVSDFYYTKDMTVINIMGSSCLAAN